MNFRKLCLVVSASLGMVLATQNSYAQDKDGGKKKFNLKERGLKLRENLGKGLVKLMTAKTDQLSLISAHAQYVTGMFPLYTDASDVGYYPETIEEGDHLLLVSLMKNEGMGVYELEGSITYNGEALTYIGGGAYLIEIPRNDVGPKTIEVVANSGQKATITIEPVETIEIVEVKGEQSLPVIDLNEDMPLKVATSQITDDAELRLAFLTDAAGARFWNRFLTMKSKEGAITVPKEAFSSTEVTASHGNITNFIQGNNFLLAEKRVLIEPDKVGDNKGDFANLEISSSSYAALPVVIKGKQEGGMLNYISIREKWAAPNGELKVEIYKPNAQHGMPLSLADTFGLTSLSVEGSTYQSSSETSERYNYLTDVKTITTVTTTYQFPQLPDDRWQEALGLFYVNFIESLESAIDVKFAELETITSSPSYASYPTADKNTKKVVSKAYKSTKRTNPERIWEILGGVSSNTTSDRPVINLMKETSTNGLVDMSISFQVAANKNENIVLIPNITVSIKGRNSLGNNEEISFATITVSAKDGVPFNEAAVKKDGSTLYNTLRGPELIEALYNAIKRLQAKEIELGYERIWSLKQ